MLENIIGLDFNQLLLIYLVVIVAALLRAFTGFGFALAAVPGFSLLLSPVQSVVLSTALVFLISLVAIRSYWGVVPVRPMLPIVLMMLVGTAIGIAILAIISKNQFQLGVGVSVLLACVVLFFLKPSDQLKNPFIAWFAGLISGIMNGVAAISGPPMVVYAMLTQAEPKQNRAWLMTILGIASVLALVSFGIAGFIDSTALLLVVLVFPALYLGNYLGTYLFRRFGNSLYRRIALTVLVLIGVSITLRAVL